MSRIVTRSGRETPPNTLTNTTYGLTNEEIAAQFPAVFAEQPHESRGSRYMLVKTYELLDGLRRDLGYVPTTVMHQRARIDRPGLQSHGKHLIRFSHMNDLQISQGERHEVIMVNSHNGTSSYQFMSGLFRLVCENGCIFGDLDNSLRVRHTGNDDLLRSLMDATYQIAANSVNIMQEIEVMKQIRLSQQEQLYLAEAAMTVRFDDKVTVVESDNGPVIDRSLVAFQPQDFLRIHRWDDKQQADGSRDLYTTYQVLQENMVGKSITSRQRGTNHRRSSARALNGIDGNVKVNAGLWLLTQRMAELKG